MPHSKKEEEEEEEEKSQFLFSPQCRILLTLKIITVPHVASQYGAAQPRQEDTMHMSSEWAELVLLEWSV